MKWASSPPWKADFTFEGAVVLEFGPSVAAGLVHFVVAVPGELDGIAVAAAMDGAGDAIEGELATVLAVEQDVSSPTTAMS